MVIFEDCTYKLENSVIVAVTRLSPVTALDIPAWRFEVLFKELTKCLGGIFTPLILL